MNIIKCFLAIAIFGIANCKWIIDINAHNPIDSYSLGKRFEYTINDTKYFKFYENENKFIFEFSSPLISKDTAPFIISTTVSTNYGYDFEPSDVEFYEDENTSFMYIVFTLEDLKKINNWEFYKRQNYYDYYSYHLSIEYLTVEQESLLQNYGFFLSVGVPQNTMGEYVMEVSQLYNPKCDCVLDPTIPLRGTIFTGKNCDTLLNEGSVVKIGLEICLKISGTTKDLEAYEFDTKMLEMTYKDINSQDIKIDMMPVARIFNYKGSSYAVIRMTTTYRFLKTSA